MYVPYTRFSAPYVFKVLENDFKFPSQNLNKYTGVILNFYFYSKI